MTDEYLNKQEVADLLKISKSTVNAWVACGFLPHVKLRRTIRFIPDQIQEWVRKHGAGAEAQEPIE